MSAAGAIAGDAMIVGTVARILGDLCTQEHVRDAERDGHLPAPLWDELRAGGFLLVGLDEEHGGGGTLHDAAALLRLAGAHAAPVPLAENGMLGARLLADAGMAADMGTIGFAPGLPAETLAVTPRSGGWTLTGTAPRVPWGRDADRLVALVDAGGDAGPLVVSAPIADATITLGLDLAGEPRDAVTFDGVALDETAVRQAPPGVDRYVLRARGALTRVLLMAGAMERVRDLCILHCADRRQFGRPLDRFQAVAQNLAVIIELTASATMAADLATIEAGAGTGHADAMAAKVVTGAAATEVARLAHQVHGAIGVTEEYTLQQLTRRLWSWRDEYGAEAYWAVRIGRRIASARGTGAWVAIAADFDEQPLTVR